MKSIALNLSERSSSINWSRATDDFGSSIQAALVVAGTPDGSSLVFSGMGNPYIGRAGKSVVSSAEGATHLAQGIALDTAWFLSKFDEGEDTDVASMIVNPVLLEPQSILLEAFFKSRGGEERPGISSYVV